MIKNKYMEFDGSRILSGNLKIIIEDIINIGWNAGLPFLAGLLTITKSYWFIFLFIIPAWLSINFRFKNA